MKVPGREEPLTAQDCMTREPRAVAPDMSVWAALAIMRGADVRHLLVVEEAGLVGILSNRDYRKILEWMRPDGTLGDVQEVAVARIMTPADRILTASPETRLFDVARLITRHRIGCIPVVAASGRPVGILTQKDVMAGLITLLEGGDVE